MNRILMSALALMIVLFTAGSVFASGAIAVDDEKGVSSSSVGYGIGSGATKEDAAKDAVKECKKSGNKSCDVVSKYNHCGAYAASSKYASGATGDTEEIAKRKALKECGDSACRIVVSDCAK